MSQTAALALTTAGEDPLVGSADTPTADFESLYRLFACEIASYVLRSVGDRHAAEDIASQTFTNALRTFHRFRDRGDGGRAWLYRIATNEIRRHVRRSAAHRRALPPVEAAPAPADEALKARARAVFATLPWKHRSVLLLHHVQGLSVAQTACVLCCREGTVKSRLARARQSMLHELNRTGESQ